MIDLSGIGEFIRNNQFALKADGRTSMATLQGEILDNLAWGRSAADL